MIMADNITMTEFAQRFVAGDFESSRLAVQQEAGWYDWWCRASALANKTRVLGKKVLAIMDSKRFDKNKCYVFFKNNCPMVGKLYDQFSICDMATGNVLFCIQYLEKGSHGCDKAHWELYDNNVGFDVPVVNGSWRECIKYFMNN